MRATAQEGRNEMKRLGQEAFTLIEMLVVIALIGMLGAIVGANIIEQFNQSKVKGTYAQMDVISQSLKLFQMDCGFYPTSEQGLEALTEKPGGRPCRRYNSNGYLDRDKPFPTDAWGFDFVYESNGRNYEIKSLGADGSEGGESFDGDLSSKDKDRG